MTSKEVEAELKCLFEQGADHPAYPISTAHLPTSAAMPLKSIIESLEKKLNQDFFSSDNVIIPKKKKQSRKDNLLITIVQQRLKRETF